MFNRICKYVCAIYIPKYTNFLITFLSFLWIQIQNIQNENYEKMFWRLKVTD